MNPPFHITVIGLGAMGGGMARTLMESDSTAIVIGYDTDKNLCTKFYQETVTAGKGRRNPTTKKNNGPPRSLSQSITSETQVVILVLQNESQCDAVCFGATENEPSLVSLLPKESVVILCSTVTPTWAIRASTKFQEHDIYFIDSPISGGPVRARDGELTLLSSADDYSITILKEAMKPIMEAMGKECYIIEGGAGKGSMVKMVHQLLAGVHIVVAAEALALAAKAGLDVEQVYNIVNGAAGASWMFQDRGQRMITSDSETTEVKSQLQIFVKDLDIVYAEAKRLQSPIPLASTALQQFINAQGLGLSSNDDSSIKRVYEQISGVPIAAASSKTTTSSTNEDDNLIEYNRRLPSRRKEKDEMEKETVRRSIKVTDSSLQPGGAYKKRLQRDLYHWPKQAKPSQRCAIHRWASGIELKERVVRCSDCEVHLCLHCFQLFHMVPNLVEKKDFLREIFIKEQEERAKNIEARKSDNKTTSESNSNIEELINEELFR